MGPVVVAVAVAVAVALVVAVVAGERQHLGSHSYQRKKFVVKLLLQH